MLKKKDFLILLFILFISSILRFYNLMHDSPYFFNPDERNMANAISQFRLPVKLSDIPQCISSEFNILYPKPYPLNSNCNLNPHFFSYGQFPLYLAFASDQVIQSFWQVPTLVGTRPESDPGQARMTSFPSAIFWLRFYSTLSSILTVLLVFLISKNLLTTYFSLLATLFAAFTPGLIQSAHFGTTESLLTFFFLASIYLSLNLFNKTQRPLSITKEILLLSLIIGLALGSKLTGIFFFIPPFIVLAIRIIQLFEKRKNQWIIVRRRRMGLWPRLLGYWVIGLFILIGSITIFFLSSPYNLVEPESFKSAVFGYESDVATGKYEAFYTRQFVNTTPIIFQAEKIFPYVLGWPVFVLGIVGLTFMSIHLIFWTLRINRGKMKQFYNAKMIQKDNCNIVTLLIVSFLIYLLPNAFLFAKWTRFMIPVLPFFAIFAVYFLFKLKLSPKLGYWVIGLLVITSVIPGLMFMSIYSHEDTRITTSKWIYKNIPNHSYILSETANVVDIPLGLPVNSQQSTVNSYTVISFDFYHMDENHQYFEQLLAHLEKADYIFIPSRRIFTNYTKLPCKYPLVTKYYQLLFSGALGFEKATEINSIPDEQAEETFTVFDHPVIRIYRKTKQLSQLDYRRLFESK